MNNNKLTFINYNEFVEKFTDLSKNNYQKLVEKEKLAKKTINAARSRNTQKLKSFIEDLAEEEAIKRIITETIATNLKDVDASLKIKMQALIEVDVYKEIMEHLTKLEKSSRKMHPAAKEALINKYMTTSVISTLISRNFKNEFTEKCAKIGSDIYSINASSHRSGVLISGIGMAFTTNTPYEFMNDFKPGTGLYFYIQDALLYTDILQKKQEKSLRKIVGDIKLPTIINKTKRRLNTLRNYVVKDPLSYLVMGDSTGMCKYANFTDFFSTVCAAPATDSILTAIQRETEEQK